MKWSKLKKLVEAGFAPSVRGHVHVHSTENRPRGEAYDVGWIEIDKKAVGVFKCFLYYHPDGEERPTPAGQFARPGEFSRHDLHSACWYIVHAGVDNASESNEPILVSLAVLDRRVGKRRLRRMAQATDLHPLARALLEYRTGQENMTLERGPQPVLTSNGASNDL